MVERSFRNGHCEEATNIVWQVRSSEGWRIDVNSLNLVPITSEESSYFGVSELSEDGFSIEGKVSNSGDCVRVLGKIVARDRRGVLSVSGTYKEAREVLAPEN